MKKQNGFTILELMIATSIFAVILLTGSVLIVQIGKMYYKGVNYSRVQETARNVVDEISRNAQMSRNSMLGNTNVVENGAVCIGNTKYSYNIDKPIIANNNLNVALKKSEFTGGTCIYDEINGQELLSENMRLMKFKVEQNGNLVDVKVQIIYASGGDDANNPGNDLYNVDTTNPIDDPPVTCKGDVTGSQWCATSYLTTKVFKRLE